MKENRLRKRPVVRRYMSAGDVRYLSSAFEITSHLTQVRTGFLQVGEVDVDCEVALARAIERVYNLVILESLYTTHITSDDAYQIACLRTLNELP